MLYESERTQVCRMWLEHGATSVIRKWIKRGGPQHQREVTVLRRLAGVPGVAQLAAVDDPDVGITLVDTGGRSLDHAPMPMDMPQLLALAASLATAVAGVHRAGVVHHDINPANIVVDASGTRVELIDFGSASIFVEERRQVPHEGEVAGTLAYLAPELTGRTGQPVDHRADLYAVGATLYELATGSPPFGDGDPLTLIHDHLARPPVPPAERNTAVPEILSKVILRLLEKEPDRRYQSGEGLAYDLTRIRDGYGRGVAVSFPLGRRDFPYRLTPPSGLVGRDAQVAQLRAAFDDVVDGGRQAVLISGGPGVGKTALIDELRPVVTATGGWFLSATFDQYRQDSTATPIRHALRSLGRLLLAEPEETLAGLRARLIAALGSGCGLVTAVLPEFEALLGVPAEDVTDDPKQAQWRLHHTSAALLRAICTPQRPIVLVVDNLQWAPAASLGFLDAVLADPDLTGLLLVAAYRDADVHQAHPLSVLIDRWARMDPAPRRLRLDNLPPGEVAELLAKMLRLPPMRAAALAELIGAATDGNPYDTVELVNGLRRAGVLVPGGDDWHWRPDVIWQFVRSGDVVDLLTARIGALQPTTGRLLEVMACLGGEVEVSLLGVATEQSAADLTEAMLPALEDGLLVLDRDGGTSVRFRHDRVQEAAYRRLSPGVRQERHLSLARRLGAVPELSVVAAEQYLAAGAVLDDAPERDRVVGLLRTAADAARLVGQHGTVERYLRAALRTSDPSNTPLRVELTAAWHAALYALGSRTEIDEAYEWLRKQCPDLLDRLDSVCVQIASLTNRSRPTEAMALGLDGLRQLGMPVPGRQERLARITAGLSQVCQWAQHGEGPTDDPGAEPADPKVLAAGRLIDRLMPAATFTDQTLLAVLVLMAGELWIGQGPAASLVGPFGHVGFVATEVLGDVRMGAMAVRRVIADSSARGYAPHTAHARFLYAASSGHWFSSLEDNIAQATLAREALIQGGDVQNACFASYVVVVESLDCTDTLERYTADVKRALAFAIRTGNDQAADSFIIFRQLALALSGQTGRSGGLSDDSFDEYAHERALASNPPARAFLCLARALLALLTDDLAGAARHTDALEPLLPAITSTYATALPYLLRGVTLAAGAREAAEPIRGSMLARVAACQDWLAERALDAPANFQHLACLVAAERAWAAGDFAGAVREYDAALRQVRQVRRPWHHAFILERAARFYQAHGVHTVAEQHLAQAAECYAAWGATDSVERLRAAGVRVTEPATPAIPTRSSQQISHSAIDMVAILRASQVLSAETDLERLRQRVSEILGALTGATVVQLALHDEDGMWSVPAATSTGPPIELFDAGSRGLVPLSAFRYAERTRAPLVIGDVANDARLAHDPYAARLHQGSLLLVPILSQGAIRAMLVLANHLSRDAFTTERLDTVMLIAGQLAVSLDNALLYASLERRVAERTAALRSANEQLGLLSVTDPLTGLANRRRLEEAVDREWDRGRRSKGPLGIAMVDIDHFKAFNDHLGHLAGDKCLQRVGRALRASVRSTDLVARYGGEEFCVVMPNADLAGACAVAHRIREAIASLRQPHPTASGGFVTVSIGVASAYPADDSQPDQLITSADMALYQAKSNGRDQIATGYPVDLV